MKEVRNETICIEFWHTIFKFIRGWKKMKKWISVALATFCTVGFVEAACFDHMYGDIS